MECDCKDFQEIKEKYNNIELKENWSEFLEEKEIITIMQFIEMRRNTTNRCLYCWEKREGKHARNRKVN